MARKRVNVKFLAITAGVVVGVAGAIGGAYLTLFHDDPIKLVEAADQMMTQHRYTDAVVLYGKAIPYSRTPLNYTKLGEAFRAAAGQDQEFLGRARGSWEHALEIDPKYMPALVELLRFYIDLSQVDPRPEIFDQIKELAERIEAITPHDTIAASQGPIATIRGWLASGQVKPQQVDEAIDKLTSLIDREEKALAGTGPDKGYVKQLNPDLGLYIAEARRKKAEEQVNMNRLDQAQYQCEQTEKLFDRLVKDHDQNAPLAYRAWQAYSMFTGVDSQHRDELKEKAQTALDRARALVDQKDPMYVEINSAAAEALAARGDKAGAEKLLRQLMDQNPKDPMIKLRLAQMIAREPSRRQEAMQLLSEETESGTDIKSISTKMQMRMLLSATLMDLRMQTYSEIKDPKDPKKAELLKQMDDAMAKLATQGGESSPLVLRMRGKLQLLKGDNIEAIQTLTKARQVLPNDLELTYMLARAYSLAQQTGEAKKLLEAVVLQQPRAMYARLLLCDLYRKDNQSDLALAQLDILDKMAPDNPDVLKLDSALRTKEQADESFNKLPEGTDDQKLIKAKAALSLQNRQEDAKRLLEQLHSAHLDNDEYARLLSRIYLLQNNKDKALAVVNDSLKAKPDSSSLQNLAAMIKAAESGSAEEIDKQRRAVIDRVQDPLSRETQYAELEREYGHHDKEIEHLKAAEKINPDNPDVVDMLFRVYIETQKFDEAAAYLPKLAKDNRDQANGDLYKFRLLYAKHDYDNALELAKQVSRRLPEFAQSWVVLGQALQATRQYEQASVQYLTALDKQNNNVDALRGLIQCYYGLNQTQNAHRYIDMARAAYPNDPGFKEAEMVYQSNFGDPESVIQPRKDALAANPEDPAAWVNLGQAYTKASSWRATQPGGDEKAQEWLKQAWDNYVAAKNKWPDDPAFYGLLVDLSLRGYNVAQCDTILNELSARPAMKDRFEPLLMKAIYYAGVRRFEEADQCYKQLLEKFPKANNIRQQYAGFLQQLNKFDDALAVLKPLGDAPSVRRARIEIMIRGGKLDQAEASVQDALKQDPNDPSLLNLLAITYINAGKYDQAMERIRQALEIAPNNNLSLYYRALINLRSPRPDVGSAMRDLSIVRDANPDNVEARMALAEAMRRNNDADGAIRELDAALKVVPANKMIRAKLIEWCSLTTPQRWDDVERYIHEAESMNQLKVDPVWWRLESAMWVSRGQIDKAVDAAHTAVTMAPNDAIMNRNYLGILSSAKKFDQIITETDAMLPYKKSEVWWVYHARGVAKGGKGDKPGAIADFEHAMQLANNAHDEEGAGVIVQSIADQIGADEAIKLIADRAATDIRYQLLSALLYKTKSDYNTAIAMAEKAVANPQAKPDELLSALRIAGSLYLAAPQPMADKAYQTYTKILQLDPNDLSAMNNLACVLTDNLNKPQDALQYSEKAYRTLMAQGVVEPLLMDTHGWTLVKCGRVPEGIAILLQAEDRKSFVDVHYHLGEAYLISNFPNEAAREFKAAADLLAQSGVQDAAWKARIDAGAAKATEALRQKSTEAKVSAEPKVN